MPPPVRLVRETACQLGEGPVWLPQEQQLRFVDIKAGRVFSYSPSDDSLTILEIGDNPSFVVPTMDGRLLIGSRNAIHHLTADGFGEVLAKLPEPVGNRTNDATVDDHGRLWFGTMDDAECEPIGAIWCLDRGTLHRAGPTAVVTNGPATSVGSNCLYHVDSVERIVWRFPLGSAPTLENGEIFLRLDEDEGNPDGIVVDSEDCLWVALWDGWGLRRYAPDGTLLLHVPFPCARVTKLAFGGPDLRTAYVTTARIGLSESELSAQPLAGALFAFEAPAPGRLLPCVRLD